MQIDKSPFKCPYPLWVMGVIGYLSVSLAGAVLVSLKNGGHDEVWIVFHISCLLFLVGCYSRSLLPWATAHSFLVIGSVWVAFQDSSVFGWGSVICQIPFLIPFYHTLILRTCFALWERRKLRSLVGREGMVTETLGPCGGIVKIDDEEFDAHFWRDIYLPGGTPIVVKKARSIYLDVEMKAGSVTT